MESILLVIGENELSMRALDFACYLGRLTHSTITGVILESLPADHKPVLTAVHGLPSIDWKVDEPSSEDTRRRSSIEATLSHFKNACENRSVQCRVHRDSGVPAEEIVYESRYADLIVVDAATSFHGAFEGRPSEFVKDILQDAECPVVIAPENFDGFNEIVFTYDGTRSSASAIKQFTYLFPELNDKKVILLQVNEDGEWTDDEKQRWTEWLINHYSAIGFQALRGAVDDRLFDYLFGRKNSMVVMGAYGRNPVSRFFKKSHADIIIKTTALPIFIFHS
jgi:nucleotide-binding universal stress UspA family protein